MGTRLRDIVNDIEGQSLLRKGMEAAWRLQAEEKLRSLQQDNQGAPAVKEEGALECILDTSILTRKVPTVIDTGASHSIVSFRTVRRLSLKSLMRPSKKAFITAAGELNIPCSGNFSVASHHGRQYSQSELHGSRESLFFLAFGS